MKGQANHIMDPSHFLSPISFLHYLSEMRLEVNLSAALKVFFSSLTGFKGKHAATGVWKLGIMGFYRLIVCTHKSRASFAMPAGQSAEGAD